MKIHKVCAGLLASIADSSTLFISRVNLSQSSTTTAVADVAEHTYPPILHKKPIYVVKKPFSLAQRGNIERQRPISVEVNFCSLLTSYLKKWLVLIYLDLLK
jgi:hypothetical protein